MKVRTQAQMKRLRKLTAREWLVVQTQISWPACSTPGRQHQAAAARSEESGRALRKGLCSRPRREREGVHQFMHGAVNLTAAVRISVSCRE
jgi:hypothetical protein